MKTTKRAGSVLTYIDKELYKEYKKFVKSKGMLVQMALNKLIEEAIKKEIEQDGKK